MSHYAVEFEVVELSERARKLRDLINLDSKPAHSRVNFEVEVDGTAQSAGARIQLFSLIETINSRGQVMPDHIISLSAPESAEEEDRTRDSSPAQFNSLLDQRHSEPIRAD